MFVVTHVTTDGKRRSEKKFDNPELIRKYKIRMKKTGFWLHESTVKEG